MAFSFANVASEAASIGAPSQPGLQIQDGDELKEIQTAQLGFKTINADTKIRVFPSSWPIEDPPIPSAQLLSVASSQGIFAAAGPDMLIIASTNAVREALSSKEGDNVRNITPILSIPHDRLTHVAFTSDDSVLVVSGPQSNGLIAYEVNKLRSGHGEVALQINSQQSLRALVPNPNPASAHLVATVSSDGALSIADLSTGQFVHGPEGTALSKEAACVSWSNRGKQLVAGSASGTAVQLKPDGKIVSHIPRSTSIPGDTHISSISWLEDDTFLIIYTPNSTNAEEGIPLSEYYIVERSNKVSYTFHRLPEVLALFGVERLPTSHFFARLRKFEPHITDLLLVAATSATDIGIISRSSQPLGAGNSPEDLISNEYTLTALEDDTRRAALPLSEEGSLDTSPIGMAIDLSSKEPVINPLPSDPEIQETSGPVPNLLVLNTEGLLSSWWVIYTDSVKAKVTYSGFDVLKKTEEIRSATSPPADVESSSNPTQFATSNGQTAALPNSSFLQPEPAMIATTSPSLSSGLAAPTTQSVFEAPKLQPSWSNFSTGSGFGSTSKITDDKPSWTSTGFKSTPNVSASSSAFGQASFGKPAFGSPSVMSTGSTPAFGSTPMIGNRPSGFGQPTLPTFGQSGFGSASSSSPFASVGGANSSSGFSSVAKSGGFGAVSNEKEKPPQTPFAKPGTSGGFASFAGSSGFGAVSDKKDDSKESPFAKAPTGSGFGGFGQTTNSESPFAKGLGSSTFGKGQGFGGFANAGNSNQDALFTKKPFQLESSFKGDGTAKDDGPAPSGNSGVFGLGNLLGETRKDISPARNTETEMDDGYQSDSSTTGNERPFSGFSPEQKKAANDVSKQFTTPPSTITQSKTTPAPPVSNLFGLRQEQQRTPQPAVTGFSFASTTPQDTPAPSNTFFGTKPVSAATTKTTPAPAQKGEPAKPFDTLSPPQRSISDRHSGGDNAQESNKIKAEPHSDEESVDIKSIPEAPLPPDPTSNPISVIADKTLSKADSKKPAQPDDAPLPPDFLPANQSAIRAAEQAELPEDDGDAEDEEYSSDFEDSGEDITQDISPAEEVEEEPDDEATTDHIQISPESSFREADTTSSTGGLFTKVLNNEPSKPARPLFGEVGRSAPIFPPPKTQQSPRSPSPVRSFMPHDTLRSENRSVSAPLHHHQSAIEQRKVEYSQSAIAAQAARAREEEAVRERARLAALRSASERAKAEELQFLEDDEEERIHRELAMPIEPSETLDDFVTYQAGLHAESNKADIPAQIERLYQDINSMICTIGINARSISAFMMHQKQQSPIQNWPDVLKSIAPLTAMEGDWPLNDIYRLRDGSTALSTSLEQAQLEAVPQKLESCQALLTKDLFDLRTKINAIQKSLHARNHGPSATAPLSAEQASIQHDLRKASATVQTKLVRVEDTLGLMRARLAEAASQTDITKGHGISGTSVMQKKPTVEAVTNTIAKMTSMAEKKSADIDVLEAQLKKLDSPHGASLNGSHQLTDVATPHRFRTSRTKGTPGSATSSVFYTPTSQVEASAKSTRSDGGRSLATLLVSNEDRERWQVKAKRRKEVAAVLRTVLEDKRKKALASV